MNNETEPLSKVLRRPWRECLLLVNIIGASIVGIIMVETMIHWMLIYFERMLKIELPSYVHSISLHALAIVILWVALYSGAKHMIDLKRSLFDEEEAEGES